MSLSFPFSPSLSLPSFLSWQTWLILPPLFAGPSSRLSFSHSTSSCCPAMKPHNSGETGNKATLRKAWLSGAMYMLQYRTTQVMHDPYREGETHGAGTPAPTANPSCGGKTLGFHIFGSGRCNARIEQAPAKMISRFNIHSIDHLPDTPWGHACSQVYFRRSREMGQRTSICRLLSDSQGGLRNALLSS